MSLSENLPSIARLGKDLKVAATTLSIDEARFLVDEYYTIQGDRIRADNRVRAMSEGGEPHEVLTWLADNSRLLENNVKNALDSFSMAHHMGRWAREQKGVGPVIAAGFLAHIDIERAHTAGAIWRFAGLDPTSVWKKGQKRPWNASLKVLCWKLGESFKKVSGYDDAIYGHLYQERKAYEVVRDERGENAETAAAQLEAKNYGKTTDAYKALISGHLPKAQLDRRACRYAVKMFLSHYFEEAYERHHGKAPPAPFPIAHMGHAHKIERP